MNVLLKKNSPLTSEEKGLFAYFGEGAKIAPPFRILNPANIHVGDRTSIREGAFLNAFTDLSELLDFIKPAFQADFKKEDYIYQSRIHFGSDVQIGRFMLMSCTNSIVFEDSVLFSERTFVGDNNHSFTHPDVPIMLQPNKAGEPILIQQGTWVGVGVAILPGTNLGRNCVVGANSVVHGSFPSHSVIGPERARLLFRRHEE
jgi:acetyltransferase-like isoleucine patch superfamily enzyme